MKIDTYFKSMIKSIIWRTMGIIILAIITYIITRSLIQSTLITFFHHFSFIWIYFVWERLWFKIGDRITGKKRRILKAIGYEIILGHLVLGIIGWIFIGSWVSVTLITIVYIENKLWIYIVYDWMWEKIKWGKNELPAM